MAAKDSRRIAAEFYNLMQERKYDDLLALATDDATWWIAGPQDTLPLAGKHLLVDRVPHMKAAFGAANWIRYEIREINAEWDKVVVESFTKAEGPAAGQHYENENLTKFTLRDGKIQHIQGYLDTNAIFKYMAAAA